MLHGFPIADDSAARYGVSPATIDRWCRWFVILAIAARAIRYLVRFPLWEDECFLFSSLIDRDFVGLTRPLDYSQIAPILYLWSQLAVVRLLGANEWTLRLTAFVAGLVSVWLFARLAKTFLSGLPRLFAVAIFCVSYVGIRYSAEAKPYGLDLLASLAMTSLAVEWLRSGGRTSRLVPFVALVPPMLGFSFPSVFVGGGLSLAIALYLRRHGTPRLWTGWAIFNVILVVAFGLVYAVSLRQRMESGLTTMQDYWEDAFPPLGRPWLLPLWLVRVHASDMTAYPVGGPAFASSVPFLVWIAGLASLVRSRRRQLLAFCLTPLLLTFVAAALQKYPYGGHFKFSMYLAPWICIVLGCGKTRIVDFVADRLRSTASPTAILRGFLVSLAAIAVLTSARDVIWPYKSVGDARDRAFAQWFWNEQGHYGEAVSTKWDLGLDPNPSTHTQLNYAAVYRCNMMIYSDRHRARRPIDWERINHSHPLVCAMYRDPWEPFDREMMDSWLAQLSSKYELTSRTRLPVFRKEHGDRFLVSEAFVEVFRFVPRE